MAKRRTGYKQVISQNRERAEHRDVPGGRLLTLPYANPYQTGDFLITVRSKILKGLEPELRGTFGEAIDG